MKSVEELKVGVLYTVLKECVALQYTTHPSDHPGPKMEVNFYTFNKNVPFMVTEIKTLEDGPRTNLMQRCMMKILVKDSLETCYFTPEALETFLKNILEPQSS